MKKNTRYDHAKIEKKWQKEWTKKKLYKASDTSCAKKFYPLVEFPFPSGAGLHTGHIRSYTAMDVVARKHRMQGENVLYPIGWDAFGLPTENYAIKTGIQPKVATKQNTDNFRRQLVSLGLSFDWSREVNTTDPEYYKWTQWIFLQMYKKGLAYKDRIEINWCPKDKIGLANEEVVNGCCDRCGTTVEKRKKEQWMLGITKYADRLDKDLDDVNYLEKIKIQQRNWIGKSEGAEFEFKIKDSTERITVFTTRADTLFGVTYVVLAPEHVLVNTLSASNKEEIQKYVADAKAKTEIERTDAKKEKTGIKMEGITAINPATGEEIPVFVADYVLNDYGTGAVMAVPAHDERDFAFAQKYNLPIKEVIEPVTGTPLPNAEFRRSIVAVVENPRDGKILSINWGPQLGGYLFIGGGLEANEDPIETAKREICEETGYKNIKLVSVSGKNHHHYFAHSKNVARKIEVTGLHFVLENEEKVEQKLEENEKNKFTVEWLTKAEAENKVQDENHLLQFKKFIKNECYTGTGIISNSKKYDGITSEEARKEITKAFGKTVVKYKLRDWVFSRQRYWGEPIPMIKCEKCGWVPVPEKDLPVTLPAVKKYEPTDNGESPLAAITKWTNVKCPTCKGKATRETDTMPNWAGSSWYYLRYADPKNKKAFASKKQLDQWTPVDWYNGGMEHTTLHLLYSRFWHKFLFDEGLVPTSEPYAKRTSHGMILAEGGEKMSKSKGNVVNPDTLVETFGADSLRLYEMFMGPFDQSVAWSSESIVGSRRFVERMWNMQTKVVTDKKKKDSEVSCVIPKDLETLLHQTIKKVTDDIEVMGFNTAISALMILLNRIEKEEKVATETYETLLKLVAPFAPHIADELWAILGNKKSIHVSAWPTYDATKLVSEEVTIMIQVNGKVRGSIVCERGISQSEALQLAKQEINVAKWLEGKNIRKEIYVPGKLVSLVVD